MYKVLLLELLVIGQSTLLSLSGARI